MQNANDASLVARLSYGAASVLLPGDIEAEVEHALLAEQMPLHSAVPSKWATTAVVARRARVLQAVDPQVAIISVGENSSGTPVRRCWSN